MTNPTDSNKTMQKNRAIYYTGLLTDEPICESDTLYLASLKEPYPQLVDYRKNDERGTYQILTYDLKDNGDEIITESRVIDETETFVDSTVALTNYLIQKDNPTNVAVCTSPLDAIRVHEQLIVDEIEHIGTLRTLVEVDAYTKRNDILDRRINLALMTRLQDFYNQS